MRFMHLHVCPHPLTPCPPCPTPLTPVPAPHRVQNMRTWRTDLALGYPGAPAGALVHGGFFYSYNGSALAANITAGVRTLLARHPGRPVYVTGHRWVGNGRVCVCVGGVGGGALRGGEGGGGAGGAGACVRACVSSQVEGVAVDGTAGLHGGRPTLCYC